MLKLEGDAMKKLYAVFIISILALFLSGTDLQAQDGPYLLVRINLTPGMSLAPLQQAGLDIATVKPGQYVEIVCQPEDIAVIRSLGYQYQITIPDMERYYAERSGSRSMAGFHSWSESVTYLDSIHALYPNITTPKFSIGNTIEGRPMWVIKVSDNPNVDEAEPEVFFNGMIHAREPIGMEICLELLHRLTSLYGSSPQITDLVNNREIYIMPVFNVDGYVYNEQQSPQGGGMWRKNRRNNGGSYGIDLNRNFGFNWGYNDIGSSPSPSSETYRGTAAFSEPETQNVRLFCDQRYFGLALNFHSYQGIMIYSWSIPPPAWGYTPDNATFMSLSQTMAQWNGYNYGPAWEILYEVNGDANDWMYGEQSEKPKTLAWVFEVGTTGFWPSQSEIVPLVNAEINPCLFLIDQAATYAPPPISLGYISGVINDAGGNNNGSLDPGESVTFIPTLRNNGWVNATNISAHLISSDPYITITNSNATYPNLAPHQQAASNTPYGITVSTACPLEHIAPFGLIWTCAEGYSDTASFNLLVGDPLYQPLGPDAYGYKCYDIYDQNGPDFNWLEVDPTYGGAGTLLTWTGNDQTVQVNVPFTFRFYGQDFTQISVCTNGWIAMGSTTSNDWSNSAIPNADGPPNMIAPFWEDLAPDLAGHTAYYYNPTQHYFVVEYDSVREFSPTTAKETFEVVLYDPAYYPTSTGDGQILFQYKQTEDLSSNTVGIENQAQTDGLQVLFNAALNNHMAPLAPGMAYLFSTPVTSTLSLDVTLTPINPPLIIPANGGNFSFTVAVLRTVGPQAPYQAWTRIKNPDGTYTGNMLGPVTINTPVGVTISRVRNQNVPGTWGAGVFTYLGYVNNTYSYPAMDSSSFTFTKSATADGGPFVNDAICAGELFPGEMPSASLLPETSSLSEARPNPFNPSTDIRYQIQDARHVSLKVYDTAGRLVTTLVNGIKEAGTHSVTFDGSKLSSGLYFVRMQAGEFNQVRKLMLVK
jgi:hypothetical protein